MGTINLPKKTDTLPEMNNALHGGMEAPPDMQRLLSQLVDEEAGTLMRSLAEIPEEFFASLNEKCSLKEKLCSAINRHYRTLFDRYLASERNNENAFITYRSAAEITRLLQSIGGTGKFNTGEIEKTGARSNDSEHYADRLLRQDAIGFLCGDTAYSVVKCFFRDNARKPKTVTDVKLAINIPDSKCIDPQCCNYAVSKYLIKNTVSEQLLSSLRKAIEGNGEQKLDEQIMGVLDEAEITGYDLPAIREGIGKSAEYDAIRTQGFTVMVNALAALLDKFEMGYQFFENNKGKREFIIREYEDPDVSCLPDERYQIRLAYFDKARLAEECLVYDTQFEKFENAVQHLWNLMEVLYRDSKSIFKVNDFEDLSLKNKNRIKSLIKQTGSNLMSNKVHADFGKTEIRAQLVKMQERIRNMYEFLYPVERRIMEERLAVLEKENIRFDFIVNPHYLQPGLLIDVDITSIKHRKTTLSAMASLLKNLLECNPA